MRSKKILFVAMQNSPHACRWINSISNRGWDLHLFPINSIPALPMLSAVTIHKPLRTVISWRASLKSVVKSALRRVPSQGSLGNIKYSTIYPFPSVPKFELYLNRFSCQLGESGVSAPLLHSPRVLARLIQKIKPDLIHSMEFQHCGYNVLESKKYCQDDFPPWLATNWGSDIFYYRRFDSHRRQIIRLLKNIDYYSCECHRDIELARELGMSAKALTVMPNTGGFDLDRARILRTTTRTSRRKIIMIKGYQHFAGRALTALEAIERCADKVQHFDVVIFSPSEETIIRVEEIKKYTPIKNISILPYISHDGMLRMFARARVYLGVSISDAISTSALEAMAMGAFPIQTNTSCCEEWFNDGAGGYLVPPDDVVMIADRLMSALSDDCLVDSASEVNWLSIKTRLDQRDFSSRVWSFYDEIFKDMS